MLGRSPYKMVFIPRKYAKDLLRYKLEQEESCVVLRDGQRIVGKFEILDITWTMGLEYDIQSFLYGFFFRVWEWRWNEFGHLTKDELQQRVARLEQQISQYMERRHSERIEGGDEA